MAKWSCLQRAIVHAAFAIALLVTLLIPIRAAQAHAEYVRSIPAADSNVTTAPALVQVWFSEGLAQKGNSLIVRDVNGARVDNGDSTIAPGDAQSLVVTLKPLSAGIYTVIWQSTSEDDGHLNAGSFPFTVGAAPTSPSYAALLQQVSRSVRALQPPSLADAAFNLLVIFSFVLLTGRLMFWPLVLLRPDLERFNNVIYPAMRRMAGISLVMAWLATGLAALNYLSHTGWSEVAGRDGIVLAVRLVILLVISAGMWQRREHARWIVLPALGLLATQSLLSHSAAEPQWVTPVLADWVHLSFTALWLGGVAVLAVVIAPAALTGQAFLKELGIVIRRFSPIALFSVFAIGLTGIAQSASFVGSFEALFSTAYGRAILLKIGWLAALAAFGAFHQQVISPRLQAWRLRDTRGALQAARRFRVSVLAEAVVSLFLIATVGVLIALPLARDVAVDPTLQAVLQTRSDSGLNLTLGITPARAGINQFDLDVRDNNDAAALASEVVLRFDSPDANAGESELNLAPFGIGSYVGQSGMLSMIGHWQITAIVRRPNLPDVSVAYSLDLPR